MKNSPSTEYSSTARKAKEFLATHIIREAQLQNVPVSEIEQKMLYFTESGWTPPHMMEISEQFDEEYDQSEYEAKMTKLARSAAKRAKKTTGDEYARWLDAIRLLSREDHYISEFVGTPRPSYDLLKLWGTGFAIVGLFVVMIFLSDSKYFPSRDAFQIFIFGTIACLAALYIVARLVFGSRVDDWIANVIMRIMGGPDDRKRETRQK